MRALLFLVCAVGLAAQTPITASLALTGPAAAKTGAQVILTVALANGGGPAGLQWDMNGLPSGATVASLVTGKTATCNPGLARCLLIGMNAAAIPDGPVATITFTEQATASQETLLATLGASPAGSGVTVTAPAPLTVPVQTNCDLNGDGKTDQTDVGLAVQQALTTPTSVTIVQVLQEIIAANGGACLR